MSKRRGPDYEVETDPQPVGLPDDGDAMGAVQERDRDSRRRRRRVIWPLLLTAVLAGSAWSLAQAATLPPLSVVDYHAAGVVTDAAQAQIDAVVPTTGPLASAKPAPFGPQLEVILPPPPPPPPAASGKKSSTQQRKAAAAALTTTQYCDAQYGATSSASSLEGLLSAANAERAVFGLAALSWNSPLAGTAQDWSNQMSTAYNAASPGAALSHGMVPSPGGQNVAAAWTTGAGMAQATAIANAHSGWMTSPGHCTNILRASFTTMGAGTAQSADGKAWYTTVNFQ